MKNRIYFSELEHLLTENKVPPFCARCWLYLKDPWVKVVFLIFLGPNQRSAVSYTGNSWERISRSLLPSHFLTTGEKPGKGPVPLQSLFAMLRIFFKLWLCNYIIIKIIL